MTLKYKGGQGISFAPAGRSIVARGFSPWTKARPKYFRSPGGATENDRRLRSPLRGDTAVIQCSVAVWRRLLKQAQRGRA